MVLLDDGVSATAKHTSDMAGSLKSGEKLPPTAPLPVWAGAALSRLRESSPLLLFSLKLFSWAVMGVLCLDCGRAGPALSLLVSRDSCCRDPCREPAPKRSVDRSLLGGLL